MKILIVIPTYNEADNIGKIIEKILNYPNIDILVIDDNSPDNTGDIVEKMSKKNNRINLIKREKKLGLGSAYITGFNWGLKRDYDIFFEMDADLSHDPNHLPNFIKEIRNGYDIVIGSRYLSGTISVVGWDFKRLLLSKFANWYATTILGLKFLTDITSGYRCYTRECLSKINLNNIKSNGYAFQIEMIYRAVLSKCRIKEVPIIFYERDGGSSKMSKKIAIEAAIMVWKLKFLEK